MLSDAKLRANRANAKKSTGPKSKQGKAKVARNPVTHGLFCSALVLPGESKELFDVWRNSVLLVLSPQNLLEVALVDQLIAAQWKLQRLQQAEAVLHNRLSEHLKAQPNNAVKPDSPPDDADHPAYLTLAWGLLGNDDDALERHARHEQRLQRTITRILRELSKLRKDLGQLPPPPCRYLPQDADHLNPMSRYDGDDPQLDVESDDIKNDDVDEIKNDKSKATDPEPCIANDDPPRPNPTAHSHTPPFHHPHTSCPIASEIQTE